MELNRDQIIKALEYCTNYAPLRCDECPMEAPPMTFKGSLSCSDKLMEIALALITSQEQKIKELTEENERLRADIIAKETEYDDMLHQRNSVEKALETAKADTVRKIKTQVHNKAVYPSTKGDVAYISLKAFDALADGLISDKN